MPQRIFDELENDELSRDEFSVLMFLVGSIGDSGERVFKLAVLGRQVGWSEKGLEALRRVLESLERKGWIERIVKAGQHSFRVKLVRAALAVEALSTVDKAADLHPTSTSPPPDLHLTSTSRTSTPVEVESGAEPLSDSDSPPPDFHQVEVSPPTEVEVELEVEDDVVTSTETPELDRLLDELERAKLGGRFTGPQRAKTLTAWRESPDGFRWCASEALKGDKPIALFMSLLADGAHSDARTVHAPAEDAAELVVRLAKGLMRNLARSEDLGGLTWDYFRDDLDFEASRRGAEVSAAQRRELLELYRELYPGTCESADGGGADLDSGDPIENARQRVRDAARADEKWENVWPPLKAQLESAGVDVTRELEDDLFGLLEEEWAA